MSKALFGSVLESRISTLRLPPAFLLPICSRSFNQTAQIIEPTPARSNSTTPSIQFKTPLHVSETDGLDLRLRMPASSTQYQPTTATPTAIAPNVDPSVRTLLPLLAAQSTHYITTHIHGRPYLVTAGDQIRLPFKMPGVVPGDVLRLNRASVLGSRDYTLKGEPYVDERLFECRAVVLGTEAEPMRIMIKKKQRNRRKKHVRSKHKYTVLRISDVRIISPEVMER